MPISKKALLLIAVVVTCAIIIAKLSNLITVRARESNVDLDLEEDLDLDVENGYIDAKFDFIVGDSSSHLIWFMQISDLHISIFHDPTRVTELVEFCKVTIDNIKPAVVMASGDLTDAKAADNMGSHQYLKEWLLYKDFLEECRVLEKTVWLDVRGNHDNFDVINLESKENYFKNYSIQGATNPRSYLHQLKHGGEIYSFIAVDGCLEPGPRRPFNFIGLLTLSEADHVTQLARKSIRRGGNYTIWFGHYPTSSLLAPRPDGLRSIIKNHSKSLAYLCGHYHTLGGAVPNMYTLQHAGFLELELGDWKDNRKFRLLAIDHGLLSFVDVSHREWPLILITNPKHALYMMPNNEPLLIMNKSTHIRVLVFSLLDVSNVKVRVDDGEWRSCKHIKGPLYVSPWNPLDYGRGLHNVHVMVTDQLGAEKEVIQPFSLDGSAPKFPLLARAALMCNITVIFQYFFGMIVFICVVPLCVLRYLHRLTKAGHIRRPRCFFRIFRAVMRKLWILSTIDRLFFPLVIYPLYLTVGPWSIGEVVQHYTGVIFAWGIIVNGQYLPGSFTYAYGFLQMFAFQLPLILILGHSVDQRFNKCFYNQDMNPLTRWSRDLTFLGVILLQWTYAYYFWMSYGTMAFLLGPLRTWSAILATILFCMSVYLPDKCLRNAALVWYEPNTSQDNQDNQDDTLPDD